MSKAMTTTDWMGQHDLEVALVSHPMFQWEEGMLTFGSRGSKDRLTRASAHWRREGSTMDAALPCLDDPATRGILLQRLRDVLDRPWLFVQPAKPMEGEPITDWYVVDQNISIELDEYIANGYTEGEAITQAILEIPACYQPKHMGVYRD